jgi:hypothetical protein
MALQRSEAALREGLELPSCWPGGEIVLLTLMLGGDSLRQPALISFYFLSFLHPYPQIDPHM